MGKREKIERKKRENKLKDFEDVEGGTIIGECGEKGRVERMIVHWEVKTFPFFKSLCVKIFSIEGREVLGVVVMVVPLTPPQMGVGQFGGGFHGGVGGRFAEGGGLFSK